MWKPFFKSVLNFTFVTFHQIIPSNLSNLMFSNSEFGCTKVQNTMKVAYFKLIYNSKDRNYTDYRQIIFAPSFLTPKPRSFDKIKKCWNSWQRWYKVNLSQSVDEVQRSITTTSGVQLIEQWDCTAACPGRVFNF